jgi:flagellar basal-body rod protein FlgF
MLRGLYENASALLGLQHQEALLANNLANQETPGFLSEAAVFGTYFTTALAGTGSGFVGPYTMGVAVTGDRVSTVNGTLTVTERPLDVAPAPNVFLTVATPTGPSYTRDGALTVNAAGILTTAAGVPVLGAGGAVIRVGSEAGATINDAGVVSVNGKPVGQLALVTITGPLAPGGVGTTYRPVAGARVTAGGQVTPGALVLSNVNAAAGLSGLAELVGWYQANEESAHTIAQAFNTFLSTGVNP